METWSEKLKRDNEELLAKVNNLETRIAILEKFILLPEIKYITPPPFSFDWVIPPTTTGPIPTITYLT
jgi:hypothetical protein